MQIKKTTTAADAEAIIEIREVDLLSHTDVDHKLDGNFEGQSQESLQRGTFYQT